MCLKSLLYLRLFLCHTFILHKLREILLLILNIVQEDRELGNDKFAMIHLIFVNLAESMFLSSFTISPSIKSSLSSPFSDWMSTTFRMEFPPKIKYCKSFKLHSQMIPFPLAAHLRRAVVDIADLG